MMLHSLLHGTRPTDHCNGTRNSSDAFMAVQSLINRGFIDPSERATPLSFRMDVREDDNAFHVTADLPGLTEQQVEVTFEDDTLTIRGEKKVERDETKDKWHVTERSSGSFMRQISLRSDINQDQIEASFDKGVLKITLPKAPEQNKARKISIKASSN